MGIYTRVLISEQRIRILMAKKAAKTKKSDASMKRTTKKSIPAQAPLAGDTISSNVLDGAMKRCNSRLVPKELRN